ncbi:MAG: putative Ig domain-containing protein, partial [Gammaproteobacteria bacterium]|nr:putative Ig domain-containing protein [Gammaproteobacteria bacterium]
MCTIHNDPGTGSPRPRTPASGVPAVLTSVVAALLLFCVAPLGHAQTDSEPVLGTVDDQTFLKDQAVDINRATTVADPVVLPAATGGDGTLTYTLACAASETSCDATSNLPLGLAFDAADRELSGTPTAAGTYNMEYTVKDADDDSDSATFQITVALQPWLSIDDAPSVVEGGDGATPKLTFTVTLSPASSDTVTVKYADTGNGTATSGTDYDAVTADTLTFEPGETSQTFEVTVTGDTAIEPDETVVMTLSDANNALVSGGTGTGTIENDDYPVLSISPSTVVAEGDSGTVTLTWLVELNPASSDTVTVKYADAETGTATSGTDYDALTAGTLTFTPGDTLRFIQVTVNGDTDDELDETIVIKLSEPTNAQFAGGAATVEGTGTIENDDDPLITIDAPVVIEHDTTLSFTVTLSTASSDTITVKYADTGTGTATSGGDYDAVTAGTLTFDPGDTEKTIPVTVNGDNDIEMHETVVIKLSEPTEAQFADRATELTGTGTIRSDDSVLRLSVASDDEGDDGTSTVSFTVTLCNSPTDGLAGMTVRYRDVTATAGGSDLAASGTDYEAISDGVLEFASGECSKTVKVSVIGDRDDEPDERIVLEFHDPSGALFIGYVDTERKTAVIPNDDGTSARRRTLSINSPTVAEGDDGTTTLTFEVVRNGGTKSVVKVDYADAGTGTAISGDDYEAIGTGTLTFNHDETRKTIEVKVNADTVAELDETVVIELSNPYNAALATDSTGTGTITNDDDAVLTIKGSSVDEGDGEDGATAVYLAFTVRLIGTVADTVTVDYADAGTGTATSGEDYVAISTGTISFPPGETLQTLPLTVHGDTTVEPHETAV